jgi:type I restriction enzyme S subunit
VKNAWQTKPVGELLLPQTTINPLSFPEKRFSYIDVSSVSPKTFAIQEAQNLLGKDAPSRARKLVQTNDVIFATIRPTLKRVALIPSEFDGQVCSTGYVVLRPTSVLHPSYLFYWLFTKNFSQQMAALQRGASYPAVSDADVRRQPISFPSRTEQERIVTILDKAFAGIARAKANTEHSLRKVLEAYDSFLETHVTKGGEGWTNALFKDVCSIANGSQPPKSTFRKEASDGYVRLIQIRDYKSDDHTVYISKQHARSTCDVDDVMIGRYGPPVFQILRGLSGAYNVALMKAVPNERKVSKDFLFYFLNGRSLRNLIVSQSERASGQTGVRKELLEDYPFAYPDLKKQKQIVQSLFEMQESCQRLERILKNKLSALEELRQSLLYQAFSGSL